MSESRSDAAPRLLSVSVDLDPLHHYCHLHGLSASLLSDEAHRAVHALALPRLRALFEEALGIPATLFAIGRELEVHREAGPALKAAHRAGHEIANHSHSHDYALSRRPPETIALDLARAQDGLAEAVGTTPVGFRAPGYTLSPDLYRAVEDAGFTYASSVFPAAPYWLAKAAVMGGLRLLRRPSAAILDSPRVLFAPRGPYRPSPSDPYRPGTGRVVELPVTVTPRLRFPVIGTFVSTLPTAVTRKLLDACGDLPLFNLELHAVDVLDATDGLPPQLVRHQRDLAVPVSLKTARLMAAIRHLARGRDVVTLQGAAGALGMV